KGGLRPPFQNPLLVGDVRSAFGASLRVRSRRRRSREDQLTPRAEPVITATLGSFLRGRVDGVAEIDAIGVVVEEALGQPDDLADPVVGDAVEEAALLPPRAHEAAP